MKKKIFCKDCRYSYKCGEGCCSFCCVYYIKDTPYAPVREHLDP